MCSDVRPGSRCNRPFQKNDRLGCSAFGYQHKGTEKVQVISLQRGDRTILHDVLDFRRGKQFGHFVLAGYFVGPSVFILLLMDIGFRWCLLRFFLFQFLGSLISQPPVFSKLLAGHFGIANALSSDSFNQDFQIIDTIHGLVTHRQLDSEAIFLWVF